MASPTETSSAFAATVYVHILPAVWDATSQHGVFTCTARLRPDNLLIDENGHVVIIDLGCANLIHWLQEETQEHNEERSTSPVLKTQSSKFMREQTAAVGTDLYHAPEYGQKMYDSEKADVFTVGILVFLLKQPIPPFHPYFGGLKVLTDEGASSKWWDRKEFQQFAEASELKALINCLWARSPEKRPTFQQLQAAMAGDEDVLKHFPALAWLSGDLSGPLDFVRELRERRPNLSLKCTGVVEALALYVRNFSNAEDAFRSANASNSGCLSAAELTRSLQDENSTITPEGVAELMRRYMSREAHDMSLDQFKVMAKAWEFGGRPIVHDVGRMNSRHFAFSPRDGGAEKEEIAAFTSSISDAFSAAGYRVEKVSNVIDAKNFENSAAFTVTMGRGTELCQLRISTFTMDHKLVVQSRRLWGSSVEELLMLLVLNCESVSWFWFRCSSCMGKVVLPATMALWLWLLFVCHAQSVLNYVGNFRSRDVRLQQMNNDLVKTWGARVQPPADLLSPN